MDIKTHSDILGPESKPNPSQETLLEGKNLQHVDVDGVLHYLGQYGKYQVTQIFFYCICCAFVALSMIHGMFIGKYVDFRCSETNNSFGDFSLSANQTIKLSECYWEVEDNVTSHVLHKESCGKYEYRGGDTFVSYIAEWDLVCHNEVLGQLPQILLIVGQGFGASLIPPFGDRFGRKKVVLANIFGLFITMFSSAFVQQFELFLFLRFATGSFIQGAFVVMNAATIEVITIEARPMLVVTFGFVWLIPLVWSGILDYLFQDMDWRMLQIAYTLTIGIPAISSLFFLDESLRWLVGNSRTKEVVRILQKACRWNNRNYETLMDKIALNIQNGLAEQQPIDENGKSQKEEIIPDVKCKVRDTIMHKNTRKITFIMSYVWFITALAYYGILLMSTSLAGDPYVNFFLACIVEVPGTVLSFYFMKYMDRKRLMIVFNVAAAASLLLTALVGQVGLSPNVYEILVVCLTFLGQFCVIQLFACLWTYTSELYPTNLRNVGLGISSTSARVGSSFSPLFTILVRRVPWAPGALFGGGCLISSILFTMIPETRRVPLPVTLQDIDNMFTKKNKEYSTTASDHDDNSYRRREKV